MKGKKKGVKEVEVWAFSSEEKRSKGDQREGKLLAVISSWQELDDLEIFEGYFAYYNANGDSLKWCQLENLLGPRVLKKSKVFGKLPVHILLP
jgi:hypothetical protein